MRTNFRIGSALAAFMIGAALVGCGPKANQGNAGTTAEPASNSGGSTPVASNEEIKIDGSTTVYPISEILAEDFEGGKATVGKSGTGSGMKKFIAGEIDIAGASRPIKEEEDAELKKAGLDYLEIPIAYDGVSVVVNPQNNWAANMTVADLQKAFAPDSKVTTWKDINPAWPADKITFYGPSENHGTYEYFTEAVVGKKNEIRKDYQANQEYTSVITSIEGDKNGIGYAGFNYYEQNQGKVKAVTVDGVAPTAETIMDGTYKPLSRPLFLYVSKKAYDAKPAVKAFVDHAISDAGGEAVAEAKYVKFPIEVAELVRKRVAAGTTGSVFMNATPGAKLTDLLK